MASRDSHGIAIFFISNPSSGVRIHFFCVATVTDGGDFQLINKENIVKWIFSALLVLLLSGCSTRTIDLTVTQAAMLPSAGTLEITPPDFDKYHIKPKEGSFLVVTYRKPDKSENEIYLFIKLPGNMTNPSEVMKVSIPEYKGLTLDGIYLAYHHQKGAEHINLTPIYEYSTYEIEKTKTDKKYKNGDVIIYNHNMDIKLKPDLHLDKLYYYHDHEITYGRGMASV